MISNIYSIISKKEKNSAVVYSIWYYLKISVFHGGDNAPPNNHRRCNKTFVSDMGTFPYPKLLVRGIQEAPKIIGAIYVSLDWLLDLRSYC